MKFEMYHNNITVLDMERSLKFYEEALGFKEVRRRTGEGFIIVWVGNDTTSYLLELTQFTERKEPWNLGDNEIHLGVRTADFDAAYQHHKEMGCICFENKAMGLYFINDPDGYWTEIVPYR